MRKSGIIFLLLLAITACGFSPLYVQRENGGKRYFDAKFNTSISDEMKKVKVMPISGRFGQVLRNDLIDLLTPKGMPKNSRYRLYAELAERSVYKQALREDISATREMAIYRVDYYMMDGDKKVFSSNSIAYVSYDILNNPYSTTVAESNAETDAAKIISDDISLRVGAYFHALITKQGSTSDI